ncbi:hypothetical protein DFH07DRAFT_770024 [Mycena maculata]|uniref:Uncharacterized protein n=1 Tax=Mycena maculata TaxID=230809 RepID=A0AAD7JN22_9AGAR|nr:hypothetical protein DFH07DRAFT_770024 [Mycena maculata]
MNCGSGLTKVGVILKAGEDLKYTCKLALRTWIFLDATLTKGLNEGSRRPTLQGPMPHKSLPTPIQCQSVFNYDDEESEDDLPSVRKHFHQMWIDDTEQCEWWSATLQQNDGKSGITTFGHLPLYTVRQTSFDHNKLPRSLPVLNYDIHGNRMSMIHVLFQILFLGIPALNQQYLLHSFSPEKCGHHCSPPLQSTSPSAFETAFPDQWELSWS